MLLPDAGEHGSKKQRWLLASGKTFRTMVATPMMALRSSTLKKASKLQAKAFPASLACDEQGTEGTTS